MGGSAGSIKALKLIVGSLPADLKAAIFIVVHTTARERNFLADVFSAAGRLPVIQAVEGQAIITGKIYVPPPDRHLIIANNHIHIPRGPKEGLHRPSINVTFRSAAAAYRTRVIGVLLSGLLDDGAGGLWEIVHQGGLAVVQDPEDAEFPSMPLSALADVPVNYSLDAREIGPLLARLTEGGSVVNAPHVQPHEDPERFSGFTCPECRGPLWEQLHGGPAEFRCRVGHLFSLKELINEHTSTEERKLYEAILAIEEGAELASYAAGRMQDERSAALQKEAAQLRNQVEVLRKLLEERPVTPLD